LVYQLIPLEKVLPKFILKVEPKQPLGNATFGLGKVEPKLVKSFAPLLLKVEFF
jgi:hypothetical protein